MPNKKIILSFLITNLCLAFVNDNILILAILLVTWVLFLYPFKAADLYASLIGLIVFMPNNILAVKAGAFYFTNPDYLGLPIWEFFMWSYYFIILQRYSENFELPKTITKEKIISAICFALCFSLISDKNLLLYSTFALICFSVFVHSSKASKYFVALMLIMGTMIEIAGIFGGKWGYAQSHLWGLPMWYLTMWGGTGFFYFYIGLPIIKKIKN